MRSRHTSSSVSSSSLVDGPFAQAFREGDDDVRQGRSVHLRLQAWFRLLATPDVASYDSSRVDELMGQAAFARGVWSRLPVDRGG